MERFGPPLHRDPGPIPVGSTSSAGDQEQHPARSYGIDLRYLNKKDKSTAARADTDNTKQQHRVKSLVAAAKVAGLYKANRLISEPSNHGETPRSHASIKGTEVPTLGDTIGKVGSVNYATKPALRAGKFVGF